MGSEYSNLPPSIKDMKPCSKHIDVEVEYCGAWGGLEEANLTEEIIKHVFPKANVKAYSPGTTGDLIVRVDGKVIFQKKTNGNMDDNTAPEMIKKLYIVARDWSDC